MILIIFLDIDKVYLLLVDKVYIKTKEELYTIYLEKVFQNSNKNDIFIRYLIQSIL
jgi:hypothetical protein